MPMDAPSAAGEGTASGPPVHSRPAASAGRPSGLEVNVPSGLVDAVLHLVSTGPVPLGAYTLAEMVAVDAVVDFLDEPPPEESVAEAVRSLAARQLLVAQAGSDQLQVRGDLGIAMVFQQRARVLVDARVTGTMPGQVWRTLLLPQPEAVTLEVLISALGVHELALRETDEALQRLIRRLPEGEPGPLGISADEVLPTSPSTALVTVTRYRSTGTAEAAELSTDVVLAARDGRLHVFTRDPSDAARLVAQGMDREDTLEMLRSLATPLAAPDSDSKQAGETTAARAAPNSGRPNLDSLLARGRAATTSLVRTLRRKRDS